LRVTLGNSQFRTITINNALMNFGEAARYSILVPLIVRDLHDPPATAGLLIAVGGLGGVLGSAMVGRVSDKVGSGPTWRSAILAVGLFAALLPIAPARWATVAFVVSTVGISAASAACQVISGSARQAACPERLLGRLSATSRVITWGVIPLGAAAGGVLASVSRPIEVLWVPVACSVLSWVFVRASSLRHLRSLAELTPLD
jgi:predicted MFS family arabinose efflux permease